jgi:hypothetical protein
LLLPHEQQGIRGRGEVLVMIMAIPWLRMLGVQNMMGRGMMGLDGGMSMGSINREGGDMRVGSG